MQKIKLDLTSYIEINSKWIKDLNVRLNVIAKTIKLLEENIGEKLHVIGHWNGFCFFDTIPKTQATKIKIDKLDYIKVKNKNKKLCLKGHNQWS